MSKLIFTGDIHTDVPGRLPHTTWAIRVIIEYATRHGIDVIVALGDLFHHREMIPIDALNAVYTLFTEAKRRGQKWVWILGNHDMFLRHDWGVNSLRPFQDLFVVIDRVTQLKIGTQTFWTLPFVHLEGAYMKIVHELEDRADEGDILLTHIGINGAIKNTCFLLKDWSFVTFQDTKFRRVYTGHFHTMQEVTAGVWYPGSPIPFKMDEGDCDHGFFVYDIEKGEHEFVSIWDAGLEYFPDEVPPPNYLTVTPEMLKEVDPEVARNNIMRMAVPTECSPNEKHEFEEQLRAMGAKEVRWMTLSQEEKEIVTVPAAAENGEVVDPFELFLQADAENIKESGLMPDMLRRMNALLVRDGNERYVAESGDS